MSADPGIDATTYESPARSLGAFLRRMRDRTEPPVGRGTARRRASGMRREEVAVDAGISVTWYTWLEQGRPVRVSRRTLLGIARALRLDATERAHLLRLAAATRASVARPRLTHAASESVRLLADRLAPHPVYVVNGLWDVLHANPAAMRVFSDFDAQPGVTDNVLRRLFLDDGWRRCFADWEAVSGAAVAQFRVATAGMIGSERWREFVGRLTRESADFAGRWSQHALATAFPREKVVRHCDAGELTFLYASVAPDAEPGDVRMIVYTPAHATTAARLATLVNAHTTPNGATVPETVTGARQRPRAGREAAGCRMGRNSARR